MIRPLLTVAAVIGVCWLGLMLLLVVTVLQPSTAREQAESSDAFRRSAADEGANRDE